MNKLKLIAFNGGMGTGKTTAIQSIRELSWIKVTNVKFAQPLYDMQEAIYERIASVYDRPLNFIKDRKLLQWLGTEWGRESISQTLWVDLWKAKVMEVYNENPSKIIVCDDVRFDNEADAVRSLGGHVIKIISDKSFFRIDTTSGITGHKSEQGLDFKNIDYIIENNGTIEDLKASLLTFNAIKAVW